MQRIEKKLFYQGLKNYPVYKEDTDNTIFNVVNVPSVFPQGKSYFLMLGSKQFRQGSEVLVEILDSKGQIIYYEVPSYLENAGRAISVWIYDHIVPGEAFVTIVGELANVPPIWKNKPNVKTTFRIFVNPQLENRQAIKFDQLPVVTASYVDKSYLVWTEDITKETSYTLSSKADGFLGTYDRSYSRKDVNAPYNITIVNDAFPPYTPHNFVQAAWSGAIFEASDIELVNGEIVNYRGTITKLTSTSSFVVVPAFTSALEDPPVDDTKGYAQDATITYYSTQTGSASELTASFVQLKIQDLFQFSGEVDTIKVYKKNLSADTSYYLLGQYKADPTEMFLKSGSINQTLGTFTTQSDINENWQMSKIDGTFLGDPAYFPQASYSFAEVFPEAVRLEPMGASDRTWNPPPFLIFSTPDDRYFKFYPLSGSLQVPNFHEYTVTAKYYCELDNYNGGTGYYSADLELATNPSASLGIYISGSAVNPDSNLNKLGKKIGLLQSTTRRNFGELQFNFITDHNGFANLNFVVFSGVWYIADISIMAATDPGFNADELTIYAPLSNLKRDELATFKIEFLNPLGDPCVDTVETTIPIRLKNQPVYMEKNDNLVLGKLSLASTMERGIVLAGDTGSVIKSYAYAGKTAAETVDSGGMMQYSGSVFPGYKGVGFELNAGLGTGSLDFRFSPPNDSYLYISASIYALPGSNVGNAEGGGFWTDSLDHTYISRYGDVQITGSLSILGDLVYVSSSIIYSSGSTKFGNTLDDTHEFTGSVSITGGLDIDGPITSTEYFPTASWAVSASWAANADTFFYGGIASQSFGTSTTWSFAHNLDTKYVIIQTYNTNSFQIIPSNIQLIDNNNAEIYFTPSQQGIALASIGGSSIIKQATIALAASDETTQLVSTQNAATLYIPYELHILNIKASLNTSGSESCSIDVKRNGGTLFTSPLIISASEYTGSLVPTSSYIAEDDRITIDIVDAGIGATGLKVYLLGY